MYVKNFLLGRVQGIVIPAGTNMKQPLIYECNGQGAIKYGRLAEFLPGNSDFRKKF